MVTYYKSHYVQSIIDFFFVKDVSAPFKIFSTLIRGLDSEMALTRKDNEFSKESTQSSAMKSEGDERLEADDDGEF